MSIFSDGQGSISFLGHGPSDWESAGSSGIRGDSLERPNASPQPVLGWNSLARSVAVAAAAGPTISSRLYALLNDALYDSWALFDGQASTYLLAAGQKSDVARLLQQQIQPSIRLMEKDAAGAFPQPVISSLDALPLREAVMAVAASEVLRNIGSTLFSFTGKAMPADQLSAITSLKDEALAALSRAAGPAGPTLTAAALSLGGQVWDSVQARALSDRSNQSGNYADTTNYSPKGPYPSGQIPQSWQPLPTSTGVQKALTPHWGGVSPFAVTAKDLVPASILTPYKNGQLNTEFLAEMDQVLALSRDLTPEQKAIADFWSFGNGTCYPPGAWTEFADQLIIEKNLGLDQAVKLSFAVSQALFDAGIAAWQTKFRFDSVRPISAIRAFYSGSNLRDWRSIDIPGGQWNPYLPTPPFPDVASGHSAFSTAATTVLRNLLGSNLFDRTTAQAYRNYDPVSGGSVVGGSANVSFKTLSGAASQAGFSRLLGGIHMNDGNWNGQKIGTQVGAIVTSRAQSLFEGGGQQARYQQQFGTMNSDHLTGLSTSDSGAIVEVYGFAGDDILSSSGNADQRFYGGDGVDVFRLTGERPVYIRDLEINETIAVRSGLLSGSAGMSALRLTSSPLGAQFTDLSVNGKLLAYLDGQWSADQVKFTTWG